jgi:methyltransferase (TIGR00027 family)
MTGIESKPTAFESLPGGSHVAWFWDAAAHDAPTAGLATHVSENASSFYLELSSPDLLTSSLQSSVFLRATLDTISGGADGRIVTSFRSRRGLALEALFTLEPTDGYRIANAGLRLQGGASTTAVLLAAVRAAHYVVDEPTILADTLAEPLAGEFAAGFIARARSGPIALPTRYMAAARSRWAEDTLAQARTDGVDQYVLLGAGLDSFAYRRPDRDDGLQVFEVDRPTSQAWKRRRLAEVGVDIPMSVRFVPVDFERHDLDEELNRAGFDGGRPSVVAWLGVADYLTSTAIGATLDRIARWAPGTRLVLDYDLPEHLWDSFEGWDGDIMRGIAAVVATIGEPWRSLFTPEEVEVLLRAHGYGAAEHLDHDAVRSTYMGGHPPGPPGPHPWQRFVRATVARRPE